MRNTRSQGGFTLVEIAIVMVIIGLLLGGAMKGQEMIQNAKVKRVKADFDQYTAAVYFYQDSYRFMPGDNPNADDHHGVQAAEVGNGDGLVASDWRSTTANQESRLFWLHLRSAGLITGAANDQTQPSNAFGGRVGVENNVADFQGPGICFSSIDQKTAISLDTAYDDGVGTTGSVQGVTNGDVAVAYTANNYNNDICFSL